MNREEEGRSEAISGLRRALTRTIGVSLVGPFVALPWALATEASIAVYSLVVTSNLAAVAFPAFLTRELIGNKLNDTVASGVSGAVTGSLAYGYFNHFRPQSVAKGILVFSAAGIALEQANVAFETWRISKRDDIIAERKKKKEKISTE